ncbi:MAG: hypothetical protein B5M53_03640 [Candidatus Cloacimonas sp. 4484_209]|nr:NAD(P)/FAD-dependent oxidoreductase [Deltaproteobacteria bacterium]OQX55868.1 MAG: hypothetical protein B5M53_03640 [Candidatus Cloacimonas sp. 4484_209]
MRHIIVGASIAGLSAAKKIKEISPEDEVVIVSGEKVKPYGKMTLTYLLSGEVAAENFYLDVPGGIELLLNKKVVKIDPGKRTVITDSNEEFSYDKLLIATGAHAYIPEIPGSTFPSVFSVRNLEDIEKIKSRIKQSNEKRVILSGAGLINTEIGDALFKIGIPITYVIHSNRVLSQIIDEEASRIVEKRLLKQGIEVLKGESIKEIEEKDGVTFATLESGKVLKGSCVIFGKGVRPNTDLLKDSKIKTNRGILVDEHLETNARNIYAAGDVVETKDIVYGDRRLHALWPVAAEQGKIAGANMAGVPLTYPGDVSRNTLTVFGMTIFTGGMSREGKFDVYRKMENGEYRKVILKDGKLKGFIFTGEVDNPGVYIYIMKNEIEVDKLESPLLYGSISFSDLHSPARIRTFQ